MRAPYQTLTILYKKIIIKYYIAYFTEIHILFGNLYREGGKIMRHL